METATKHEEAKKLIEWMAGSHRDLLVRIVARTPPWEGTNGLGIFSFGFGEFEP